MATVIALKNAATRPVVKSSSSSLVDVPAPLGAPVRERAFWFGRGKAVTHNDAIATQVSVFDSPATAEKYQPRADWENIHRFDPSFRWTWGEEKKLTRKIDLHITAWCCIMFMALELDRSNLGQAVTDNMLQDLDITTNDFNYGNTVFKLSFLLAELPSQLVSKWLGPDRWIPLQISLWSLVAGSQFWLSSRTSFLTIRALLGILQGGFVPDIILYLSYFYKHAELTIRLGWFWTAMGLADILSSLLAYGLLHLRGLAGHAGWRWLFLIEGLLTLVIGIFAWLLMPAGPCQTASWFRGKNGWFSEREERIIVNRVIREDPSKSSMHNREPITPKLLWQSLKDYDLWPLYALGLTFDIPATPPKQYLTLSLRSLGFDTFQTSLLTIPAIVLHVVTMLGITYLAEVIQELTFVSLLGQIWLLPFVVYLNVVDTTTSNRWVVWAVISLLLAYPVAHPIQVAWNSRNANSVRLRTVSAACYNMMVQTGSIIASNIYREDDTPRYVRGNRDLLAIVCMNFVLYPLVKAYYVFRNRQKAKIWDGMTAEQKVDYLATSKEEGNKRLDFRFQH